MNLNGQIEFSEKLLPLWDVFFLVLKRTLWTYQVNSCGVQATELITLILERFLGFLGVAFSTLRSLDFHLVRWQVKAQQTCLHVLGVPNLHCYRVSFNCWWNSYHFGIRALVLRLVWLSFIFIPISYSLL
jgi:hypothetical protein